MPVPDQIRLPSSEGFYPSNVITINIHNKNFHSRIYQEYLWTKMLSEMNKGSRICSKDLLGFHF